MAKQYKAWITAHDHETLETVGSMMIAKSTDRLMVEKFIESHAATDLDACRFKGLFHHLVMFKISIEFDDESAKDAEVLQAFNVASVALSTAQSRLNQLEAVLKKKGN